MINNKVIESLKQINHKEPKMLSPAQLAYIGDAVYEVFVRTYLVQNHDYSVNELHKNAVKFVKAEYQAKFLHAIDEMLTDEERRIAKRGRNAKITSVPKNALMKDYRHATGFEALIGYLFLNNEYERLLLLFSKIIEISKGIGDVE